MHGSVDLSVGRAGPRRARWALRFPVLVVACVALVAACLATASAPRAEAAPLGMPSAPEAPAATPPLTNSQITNLGYGLAGPRGITTGSDGNLWIVEVGGQGNTSRWISRSTPSGAITHFPEVGFALGDGIVSAPDGNLWFGGAGTVARMTPAGVVTTFADPAIGFVEDITVGPDGALWFADPWKDSIGRITTGGSLTMFAAADLDAPNVIIAGPDGNLWFANGSMKVGRMGPTGVSASFPVPGPAKATALAVGPDGNLWYAGQNGVGKVTMAGVASFVAFDGGNPTSILLRSDGSFLLAMAWRADKLARLTTDGVVTALPAGWGPVPGGQLRDLTEGPDGAVWFTSTDNTIGSVTAAGAVTIHRGIPVDQPGTILASPAGDLLFANPNWIGRATTGGAITRALVQPQGTAMNANLMTIGPDGNLWYSGGSGVHRVNPDGSTTFFPTSLGNLLGLTLGPDGWLWFTAAKYPPYDPYVWPVPPPVYNIARMSIWGQVQPVYQSAQSATRIIDGPDGNLWFVRGATQLGRLTPAGVVDVFDAGAGLPVGVTRIEGFAAGPDGNIWFTTGPTAAIGRTTPQGVTTLFPTGSLVPQAITAGPDGNLWFTSWPNDAIGRITPSGEVSSITDTTVDHALSIVAGPDGNLWFTNQGNNSIGRVDLTPAAPTQVLASAGTTTAKVSWTVSPATGGVPGVLYTVTASPGPATCTTAGAPTCVVPGLTPGTPYTFTVTATNRVGTSPASLPSAPVTPGRGGGYHPLAPARLLDSRLSAGGWASPLVAGSPRDLPVAGSDGVPASAAAIVMNVTATGGSSSSFVAVWPAGEPQPPTSNLNFAAGETVPNLVTVKLGAGGRVSFANAVGAVDLVADVVGYYDDGIGTGDLFNGITPTRLLDSRTPTGKWGGPLEAGAPRDLDVRQPGVAGGVPATATALVLNVTATGATAGSYLSLWPSGIEKPGVSNLNFGAGQTIPNLVVVKIGDNGRVRFANAAGAVDVVADAVAYFDPTAGARFHAITPTRVLDDRAGTGLVGPWGPGESRTLSIAGAPGSNVAADAAGVVLNVTATGATEASFVTVYPAGGPRPGSSNLNFGVGQTIPNLVMTGVGTGGAVALANTNGSVDLIADAVGYFRPT
jgi:streptogramin lyase